MAHHTRRSLPLFLAFLALGACSDIDPTSPDLAPSDLEAAKQAKVGVCHYSADDGGSFHLISIAAPAVAAHMAHGDGLPGSPQPGNAGWFTDDCGTLAVMLIPSTTIEYGTFGGGGGAVFAADECPAGSVGTGFSGNAESYFGWAALWNLSLTCRELNGDGTLGAVTNLPSHASNYGNMAGPFAGECAGGQVLTGADGWIAFNVNSLAGLCSTVQRVLDAGPWGFDTYVGPFSSPYSGFFGFGANYCPTGYVITGMHGREGDIIDAIGFRCTQVQLVEG